jgi:hypothetical protein
MLNILHDTWYSSKTKLRTCPKPKRNPNAAVNLNQGAEDVRDIRINNKGGTFAA